MHLLLLLTPVTFCRGRVLVVAVQPLGHCPTCLELQQESRQAQHSALLPKLAAGPPASCNSVSLSPASLPVAARFSKPPALGRHALAGRTAVRPLSPACNAQGPSRGTRPKRMSQRAKSSDSNGSSILDAEDTQVR